MDAEAARGAARGDELRARGRRDWERIAYGPNASAAEREAARAALEALRPSAAALVVVAAAPAADELPTEAPGARSRPAPARVRFRFRGVAVALAVVATLLVAVALLPRVLEPGSGDIFSRGQTDADRNMPVWLADALATAAVASGQAGVGAQLHSTVRRIHDTKRSAFVFTDAEAGTVCMAVAADALACVPAATFGRDGIRIDTVDQSAAGGTQGLRYEWGPRGGLRSQPFPFDSPLRAFPMAAGDWSVLVTRCMAERGYAVRTTSEGDVIPKTVSQQSTVGFTINRVGCTSRYPLYGVAFGPTHFADR